MTSGKRVSHPSPAYGSPSAVMMDPKRANSRKSPMWIKDARAEEGAVSSFLSYVVNPHHVAAATEWGNSRASE